MPAKRGKSRVAPRAPRAARPARTRAARAKPAVVALAALTDGVYLMVVSLGHSSSASAAAFLRGWPGLSAPGGMLVCRSPQAMGRDRSLGLILARVDAASRNGGADPAISPALMAHVTDLPTLLRSHLSGFDAPQRVGVMEYLASAAAEPAKPRKSRNLFNHADPEETLALHRALRVVREALRERLPASITAADQSQVMAIDALLGIDEHCFYVRGWSLDLTTRTTRLVGVSPEGESVDLLKSAARPARPDIDQLYASADFPPGIGHGFACCFRTQQPSMLSSGWVFELHDQAGGGVEAAAPAVVRDPQQARDVMLQDLTEPRLRTGDPIVAHVVAGIKGLQERRKREAAVERVDHYGPTAGTPEISLVVPLFGRADLLEHQMVQFALDVEVSRAELIYVLDSPELGENVCEYAASLYRLYGLPFQIAVMARNCGFNSAVNAGAELAGGARLVVMHSDVLPEQPGWLGRMAEAHCAAPKVGTLAPKLLYHDDSVQHAGLEFAWPPGAWGWEAVSRFKGLSRHAPQVNVPAPLAALGAACLMIDRAMFRDAGGLNPQLLHSDFAGPDLCLRLLELGRRNVYQPDIELYHLEGQSHPPAARPAVTRMDRWSFTQFWDKRLRELCPDAAALDQRGEIRRCR